MRLDLPDPSTPTRTVSFDYPDAPIVALLTWLLAVPIWQRPPQRVSERLADFRMELATIRATAAARPATVAAAPAVPTPAESEETPGQARARRMREAKAAKRAAGA